jgi:hypothetical protein
VASGQKTAFWHSGKTAVLDLKKLLECGAFAFIIHTIRDDDQRANSLGASMMSPSTTIYRRAYYAFNLLLRTALFWLS